MPAFEMSSSQLIEVTVDTIRSSISTIKPNAMKSLITSDIVPDYTIIKIFVTSTTRAAVIFMKGIINGKIECLP